MNTNNIREASRPVPQPRGLHSTFLSFTPARVLWGVLGILSLAGVVFAGAWWHLLTALACTAMFAVSGPEDKEDEA